MNLRQFKKINDQLARAKEEAEDKLVEEGEDLTSASVKDALAEMKERIIEGANFSLGEYESVAELIKKRGSKDIDKLKGDIGEHFKENKEESSSLKEYITKKLEEVKTLIKETVFKFPKEISIRKPDWFKLPIRVKQDEAIEVKNFPDEIEISNLPEQKDFPKEIEVKKPDWWHNIDLGDIFTKIIIVRLAKDQIKPKYKADTIQVKVSNLEEIKNEQWIPQNPTTATGQRLIKEAVEDQELIGNTQADGSGTPYHIVTDNSGRLHTRSFKNAAGDGRRMLVDADRHGQVDVLSMPTGFNTNEILEVGTDTYFCKETAAGEWYIMKIDTNSVFTHATILNNAGTATYADARSGYAGLTYQTYNNAFN